MSFSQVSHFVDLLKMYLDNCEIDVPDNEMESSLDVSMQSVENDVEENGSSNTRFKLYIFFHPVNCFLYRCAAWARGALPYMTYMGYAAGQGLGFDLSVLDMVYKYVRVCPYYKQGIACTTDLICWMKLVGNPSIQKKITITWISSIRIANKWLQNNTVCISPKQVMYLRIFLSKTGSRIQTLSSSPIQQILVKYPPPPSV